MSGLSFDRTTIWLLLAVGGAFILALLAGPGYFGVRGVSEVQQLILWEIRLPRALLGVLVGAGLGVAGAALQGYLRNPLAEPGVIGVSGGAALGAVIAIHSGLAGVFPLALPVAGLLGAVAATLLVTLLAGERSGAVPLILAGVAVAALASALVSLVLNLSRNPFAAAESIFWMMGSLADRSQAHVMLAGPLIGLGIVLLLRLGRTLDALTLGEAAAESMGEDLARARRLLVAGVALAVGAATAVTGIVGFVGLVVPHILRPVVGHRPSRLLPASALGGAVLVLIADALVRLMSPIVDIRIGVLTAVLGAPFFLWLIVKLRRELAA